MVPVLLLMVLVLLMVLLLVLVLLLLLLLLLLHPLVADSQFRAIRFFISAGAAGAGGSRDRSAENRRLRW